MMNCFEFRRLVLIDPHASTPEQELHLAGCAKCASLAHEMEGFEARLHDAMHVPVPEGLAERVLLRQKIRTRGLHAWALAASLMVALGTGAYFYHSSGGDEERVFAAAKLGGTHPAVAAINYVIDHEPELLRQGRSGDPAVMRGAFTRLDLRLPTDGVTVRYLGKCPVPSGTGEHVVLQTPFGRVTLILVPDQPFASRVVVTNRDKTAVASPARTGGYYILISDSLKSVKRIEKMLM